MASILRYTVVPRGDMPGHMGGTVGGTNPEQKEFLDSHSGTHPGQEFTQTLIYSRSKLRASTLSCNDAKNAMSGVPLTRFTCIMYPAPSVGP